MYKLAIQSLKCKIRNQCNCFYVTNVTPHISLGDIKSELELMISLGEKPPGRLTEVIEKEEEEVSRYYRGKGK